MGYGKSAYRNLKRSHYRLIAIVYDEGIALTTYLFFIFDEKGNILTRFLMKREIY